ncbi:MAG: methyltransferase domain-containing protein, partial [Gemmatimonas sp.]|nr:methyltransferase domain-containing protein [Gemmatimonas sp.]
RSCAAYQATHYFPDKPPGEVHRGFRNEDLAHQTFEDETFDLVITQDVMEHILEPWAAFAEIARTLKPGGAHVFTTPIYSGLEETEIRARLRDGDVEHLAPPEHHGNPIDPEGSLVTAHWGADLAEIIAGASGMRTNIERIVDRSLGIDGEFLEVLVSVKPARAPSRTVSSRSMQPDGNPDTTDVPQPVPLRDLVPQHGYDPQLERGENPFAARFGGLSDEEWLAVLERSLEEPRIEGVEFPGFPETALQQRIHGHSGADSLREAVAFYRFCRDNTYRTPAPEGELRFLDFGAGWGRISRPFMRDFGPSGLYGYEPNLLFCSVARALNPYVCFLHGGRVPSNSLPRGWVDLVVSWSVFSHLPEWLARAWLVELHAALRPGGWCVITSWGRRFLELLREEQEKRDRGGSIHWYYEIVIDRFGDVSARLDAHDRGEYIYADDTGDGEYGDAIVSEVALRRILSEASLGFDLTRSDTSSLPQDVFVLQRPPG